MLLGSSVCPSFCFFWVVLMALVGGVNWGVGPVLAKSHFSHGMKLQVGENFSFGKARDLSFLG